MTSPGGPGYPGWSGDDPGFGVPPQPQGPQIPPEQPLYQPQPPPGTTPQYQSPPQPQAPPPFQSQPGPAPAGLPGSGAPAGGAHGRPPVDASSGPRWGRIALVAGAAVVVIAAIVFAAVWLLGGSSASVDSTRKFFEAVRAANPQAAADVTCAQAPTLADQFTQAIKGVEGTLGSLDKVDVSAPGTTTTSPNSAPEPPDPGQKRDYAEFNLTFANGSVHGRTTLVSEDGKWKVCFVDIDPPKMN